MLKAWLIALQILTASYEHDSFIMEVSRSQNCDLQTYLELAAMIPAEVTIVTTCSYYTYEGVIHIPSNVTLELR